MRAFIIVTVLLFFAFGVQAAPAKDVLSDRIDENADKNAIFTDKMEEALYSAVKDQGQGHSEAE